MQRHSVTASTMSGLPAARTGNNGPYCPYRTRSNGKLLLVLIMSISGASYTCLAIRGLFGTGAFLFIPLFLSIFFVYAVSRFIRSKTTLTTASKRIEFLAYACSVFGTCIGLIMGASKGPIASAAIPAFVTLLAGLIAYFFSRETLRSYLPGLPTIVGALGFSIAFGIFLCCIVSPINLRGSGNRSGHT